MSQFDQTPAASSSTLTPSLVRLRNMAAIVGVLGLAGTAAAYFTTPVAALQTYLIAYIFWVGMSVGSVPVILLHHLVGGKWGFAIRKPLEASAITIPLMAILFVPIALNLRALYPWMDPSELEHHPGVKAKSVYLNENAFLIRAAGYFAFWIVVSAIMYILSKRQDQPETEPRATGILGTISGPLLLLHVFVVSFAGIDWIMSLEPEWFSTIFGPLWMVGQILTTLAVMILIIAPRGPRTNRPAFETNPDVLGDLGSLLLAFVMLWAYMQLSQFLIIWSGNLLEEIPWYLKRIEGGWQGIALVLIGFQFALPFLMLLQREAKRNAARLSRLCLLVVGMNLLSTYWIMAPAFHPSRWWPHWSLAAAVLGVGGIWLSAFLTMLGRRPWVPANAPFLVPDVPQPATDAPLGGPSR